MKLIINVKERIRSEAGNGYPITGIAPRLFNFPWQNCISFCIKELAAVGIIIEPRNASWTKFCCAFPSDYIQGQELVNHSTKSGCQIF